MKLKLLILSFLAVLAMVVTSCTQYTSNIASNEVLSEALPAAAAEPAPAPTEKTVDSAPASEQKTMTEPITIKMSSTGFNPASVTVKAGQSVTWINKDAIGHWPASGPHPIHTEYPETGGCSSSTFDACAGIAPGKSWSFTFNLKGSWKYHDHLNPNLWGMVVVK